MYRKNMIARLAAAVSRLQTAYLSRKLMPHRLGSGSYIYLRMVVENPGITQTELVDRIIIDRATVSKMLNKLEKENLIRRRPHPEDGRAIVLEPTEDALGIYDSAGEVLADYQAMMLEGVSPEEQAVTLEALRKIADNIRRANDAEKKLMRVSE